MGKHHAVCTHTHTHTYNSQREHVNDTFLVPQTDGVGHSPSPLTTSATGTSQSAHPCCTPHWARTPTRPAVHATLEATHLPSAPALHSVWQHAPFIPGFAHSLVECKPCVPSGQEAGRVRSDGARVPATAPQRRPTCSARPQLPPHTDTAQANELWRLARTYTHTHTTAQHRTP